jgi:hypothetical protein
VAYGFQCRVLSHPLLSTPIDPNTVVLEDFYHQYIGHPDKKINKETLELNDIIDQMNLTDVCRVFHSQTAQYTFFSAAHGILSQINHILGQKSSLNKNKKTEITPHILSDYNSIKLELNNKGNSREYSKTWRWNNTLLHGH